MKSDVTVICGTFGDSVWIEKAKDAVKSAWDQMLRPDDVIHVHSKGLAEARNEGAEIAESKYLIFLDADDTLHEDYIFEMLEPGEDDNTSTLRQPSTLGVYPDGTEDEEPVLIPERPLNQSNYLCIGTMMEREALLKIGGFDPDLPIGEDWDVFIRLVNDGAIIGKRSKAVYRVGVNENSRNKDTKALNRVYNKIRSKYRG